MAKTTLEEALQKLDAKNDEHWTADGLPRMEVLQELTGDDTLTRRQVSDQHANFNRESLDLGKGDKPEPSGGTAQGTTSDDPAKAAEDAAAQTDPNPTEVGETGADEELGDKTVGVVGDDPEHPESDTVEVADEDEDDTAQVDADGTITASAENERNEGRGDTAEHVDADGAETASRENEKLLDNADMPPPLDADGSVTSNRQVNDEDAARRAGFEPDTADDEMAELERTDPDAEIEGEDDDEADLTGRLEDADAALAEAEEDLNRMRSRADSLRARRDAIVERRERRYDPHAGMRERMSFIARQQEARARRAGDTKAAEEALDRLRGIAGSPLDRAMARRPARGTARPPARPRKNENA